METPVGSPLKLMAIGALKPPVAMVPMLIDWLVPPVSVIGKGDTASVKPTALLPEPPQPRIMVRFAARAIAKMSRHFRIWGNLIVAVKR